ncbi:MAG TPA: folate-binding protein [Trebonia sp.]
MLDIEGAVEAAWPDEGVAAHYGDPAREQRAIAAGGALVDRSNRGVITVSGPDRLTWLHSLTSQHLERLAPGETAQALILSPQGHLEHLLTLTDDGTRTWAHVEPGTAGALVGYLNSMRFMLRVEVEDLSATHGVLSLLFQTAPGALSQTAPGALHLSSPIRDTLEDAELGAAGTASTFGMGRDLILAKDRIADVAGKPGVPVAGMWAYEAARIAAHVARPGVDTDHKTLPHEVGLIGTAVHLNKGCYRGQETVARVHNVGHPPRRLVLLHLDGSADRLPAHGSPITLDDGTEVGFAGSAARHYELGPIGLGLVKRTVPVAATLLADGVAAAQEVIVSPDAGANVTVTLRRDSVPQPPTAARRLK